MKQYWLTLYPDTFLWMQNDEGCIYNTLNFSQIRFVLTNQLRKIMAPLKELDQLYQVIINEEELATPDVKQLVDAIVDHHSGSFVPNDGKQKAPVSMFPELRIQDDMEFYQWEHERRIDGKIIHNLHRLFFYINGSDSGSSAYFRQTVFPLISAQMLDMEKICTFVANASKSNFLREISLVGNLWEYPGYADLLNRLTGMGFRVLVYMTAVDFLNHKQKAYAWEQKGIGFMILVVGKADESVFRNDRLPDKEAYTFIITSVEEYEKALKCTERYQLKGAEMVPVYNGNNLPFFKEYIYLNREEIGKIALSKREIFTHQALNVYSFGNFSVLPDGSVYANLNLPPVGNISEPPHDIVYREMSGGKSWFRVRDQEPCSSCVNQWLCPSPSNYEFVIGKPNLCHLDNH